MKIVNLISMAATILATTGAFPLEDAPTDAVSASAVQLDELRDIIEKPIPSPLAPREESGGKKNEQQHDRPTARAYSEMDCQGKHGKLVKLRKWNSEVSREEQPWTDFRVTKKEHTPIARKSFYVTVPVKMLVCPWVIYSAPGCYHSPLLPAGCHNIDQRTLKMLYRPEAVWLKRADGANVTEETYGYPVNETSANVWLGSGPVTFLGPNDPFMPTGTPEPVPTGS